MLGNPGQQIANWMATSQSGKYVTGVVGTAGLLYLANKMGVLSTDVALMAAGVSTSIVALSYLSQTIGGRVGAYLPDVFRPVEAMSGYMGGYGGYLGYLGDGSGASEEDLFGVQSSIGYSGSAGNVNVF